MTSLVENVAKRMFVKTWLDKDDTATLDQVWDGDAPAAQSYMLNAAMAIYAIERAGFRIVHPNNVERGLKIDWSTLHPIPQLLTAKHISESLNSSFDNLRLMAAQRTHIDEMTKTSDKAKALIAQLDALGEPTSEATDKIVVSKLDRDFLEHAFVKAMKLVRECARSN